MYAQENGLFIAAFVFCLVEIIIKVGKKLHGGEAVYCYGRLCCWSRTSSLMEGTLCLLGEVVLEKAPSIYIWSHW